MSRYGDMNLAIFDGQDPGGVLWQPRLEYWYAVNHARGTLPAPVAGDDILRVYDYCHASVRYFGHGLRMRYRTAEVSQEEDGKSVRRTWRTPLGSLTDTLRYDEWSLSRHLVDYQVKSVDDLRILEFLRQDEEWYWDEEAHRASMARFGAYGAPQFFFQRSPVQDLMISHMGVERTILALYDDPKAIAHYVDVATEADGRIYDILCACPVRILNLGENIDAHMDPPSIWRKHLIPYYEMRTQQLHAAGKRVHIHIDGAMKPLIPYLRDCSWDGIEAATPLPQGDVTIDDIKQGLGDLVLLDGIPALLFLPSFPVQQLIDCAKRVVELFYPRLVLGISDEIPPDGDIERVRLVGELVQDLV